jgi:DNA-binding NarL/FixJ family response regulator
MSKIRVLIADDHAIIREGIRAILEGSGDIEVVEDAKDGKEAIEKSRKLEPHVVLMDIAMPGLGGLEATLEIRKACPKTKVLVLTQYDNKEYIYRFLKAGASGYVLKKGASTELISAIRAVHGGGSFLYPDVASAVIQGYLQRNHKDIEEDAYESLTNKEKQVLKLIAEGYKNNEIADMLYMSVKTVMGHRTHIMGKLNIHSRTELVKFAIRKRLIELKP